jgi:hypothetical protein
VLGRYWHTRGFQNESQKCPQYQDSACFFEGVYAQVLMNNVTSFVESVEVYYKTLTHFLEAQDTVMEEEQFWALIKNVQLKLIGMYLS